MNITRMAAELVLGIAVVGVLLAPFTQTGGFIAILCLAVFGICRWVLGPLDESDDGDVLNENVSDRQDQSARH